jgi:hypothetical protein
MSDTTGQARKRKSQRRFEHVNHIVDSVIGNLPSVSQRLLLVVCWRFANPKGEFQVSMLRLAKTTGICHRQVRRAFDAMIDIGALQVVTPQHGRRAAVYRITGEPRS